MKERQKIAVAMSGGVDSGVAAALLVEQGYEVGGLHLNFWKESQEGAENRCCNLESMEAARKTAHQLGIPFYVKDYSEDFKKIVVDYFLREYAAGRTPNPCVVCNQFIKFGRLLEYTKALGCQFLATGHYARIVGVGRDRPVDAGEARLAPTYKLLKGIDETKDQSYFLWTLNQEKLAHILFPVGDLTKPEVRKIARETFPRTEERGHSQFASQIVKNLPISERPESFEVCFVLDKDYRDFLKRHIPGAIRPGEVVNTRGEVIGKHFGLPLYTIGQRKGFEVRSSVPLYVVGMGLEKNQLVVGRGGESERQEFTVSGVNWVSGEKGLKGIKGVKVRIRHQGPLMNAECKMQNAKTARVFLDEPVRGITPGQSAVFYQGEEVLGGGIIEKSKFQNPKFKSSSND